jgi:hypothetical protein
MLKKVEAACKLCGKQFCKKRTEQEYCSAQWSEQKEMSQEEPTQISDGWLQAERDS